MSDAYCSGCGHINPHTGGGIGVCTLAGCGCDGVGPGIPKRPVFGPHLIGDLHGVPGELANDRWFISGFLNDLTHYIGLKPMGFPHLDKYKGPHAAWNGFSATQHIETSHITMHMFEFGYAFIDIFSCMPFAKDPRDFIERELRPTGTRWQNIERGYLFPPELMEGATP